MRSSAPRTIISAALVVCAVGHAGADAIVVTQAMTAVDDRRGLRRRRSDPARDGDRQLGSRFLPQPVTRLDLREAGTPARAPRSSASSAFSSKTWCSGSTTARRCLDCCARWRVASASVATWSRASRYQWPRMKARRFCLSCSSTPSVAVPRRCRSVPHAPRRARLPRASASSSITRPSL